MDAVISPDAAVLASQGLAIVMGLALAATCGLRAFLPLFVLSLLSLTGKVQLSESFAWVGSPLAALCFGVAVVAELLGDKIPVVDHALDTLGVAVKPVAATLAVASVATGMDPMVATVLGLLTGGVAAEGVHLTKAKARLLSTAFTGTLGNPILSVIEDVLAFLGVLMAWLLPVLVLAGVTLVMALVWGRWWRKRRAAAATAQPG